MTFAQRWSLGVKPTFRGWSGSQRLVVPAWMTRHPGPQCSGLILSPCYPQRTAAVGVGVVMTSPFALLMFGVISTRGQGECSGWGGEQRIVGWLQALELLEILKDSRCWKTNQQHVISIKPWVSYWRLSPDSLLLLLTLPPLESRWGDKKGFLLFIWEREWERRIGCNQLCKSG